MPLLFVFAVVSNRPRVNVTGAFAMGAPAASASFADTVAASPYWTFVAPRLVSTAAGGPKHLLSPTVQVSVLVAPLSLTVLSHWLPTAYSSVCDTAETTVIGPVSFAAPYFSMSAIGRSQTTHLLV